MALSADNRTYLNKMNSTAQKVQLGTLMESALQASHFVKFAGTATSVGGAAAEDFTVTGALASDIAIVVLKVKGAAPQTILTAVAATDKITVTFSGDPSNDHVISYMILRALS